MPFSFINVESPTPYFEAISERVSPETTVTMTGPAGCNGPETPGTFSSCPAKIEFAFVIPFASIREATETP